MSLGSFFKKAATVAVSAAKAHPAIAAAVVVTVTKKVDPKLGKKLETTLPVVLATGPSLVGSLIAQRSFGAPAAE